MSDSEILDALRAVLERSPEASRRPEPEVMGVTEVAEFLRVDRKTIYDAAARQEIPHQRLGRRLLFSRLALVEWLACKGSSAGEK